MTALPTYTCDGCGACCRTFPIYVTDDDAVREPRVNAEGRRNTNSSIYPICLYPLPFHEGCCFLNQHQQCTVYETRPQVCRDLAAGSEQCQEARRRQGLMPLIHDDTTDVFR